MATVKIWSPTDGFNAITMTTWTKSSGVATTWTKGSAVADDWTKRDTTEIVNLGAIMDDTVYIMDDSICTMDDLKLNTQVAQGTTWTKT